MASTYVNDLRLNEMATGDASGTWGTVTNTNLELIGEALGFGTEAITTNADTHTSTVADGATDPARAMYIKYTGTLDSACTITIAPNTLNRLHFIENGTSGSQNIIISQGSGANVTIPPGDTKAVYLDGAGSGAAVVDAFASLNVVDLKVEDDLTVTDDATIGGTLGVTGVVTANAGVVVDNITIDGTEIDLSSGDFTLDVAGNIFLNADGGDIRLVDDSTQFGLLQNNSSDFVIQSSVSNKDIILKGNDDGSGVTALTLDMSDAGTAIFNHDLKVADNNNMQFGAGADLMLSSDGTNGTIATLNGDLTLDVAGDITLDADGGSIILKDGGTQFGLIAKTSNDLGIYASIADEDIVFKGTDGSTAITALTLDMSAAGDATFNQDIYVRNIYGASDGNTGIQWEGNDNLTFHAGGAECLQLVNNSIVFNQDSADIDFRVESNDNEGMIYVDAGNNRVAIGTTAPPAQSLTVVGASGSNVGGLTTGILALTTGTGVIADTRMLFGIVDDNYGWIQTADYGVAYRTLILNPNGGNVLVGTTDQSPAEGTANGVRIGNNGTSQFSSNGDAGLTSNRTGDNGNVMTFRRDGTLVGTISVTGSSTAFNTSSDYRLKENVNYDFDATSRIKELKPCRFNFISDADTTVDGFLAHQVSSVVPEAITGEKDGTQDLGTIKDANGNILSENVLESTKEDGQTWTKTKTENVYQNIDQSKIVPLLVKTIQELEARITALESA